MQLCIFFRTKKVKTSAFSSHLFLFLTNCSSSSEALSFYFMSTSHIPEIKNSSLSITTTHSFYRIDWTFEIGTPPQYPETIQS